MNLKGSKTEANLLAAFAGESQARNKYEFFASQAKKEGFEQISGLLQETANNEKEHAKRFYKFLIGGSIKDTATNLLDAADGELEEHNSMYPEFARIAEKEGFLDIAEAFRKIAEVEEAHEKRYRILLENLKRDSIFKKPAAVKWKCRNCGYIHEGSEAPEVCPACVHPRAYFEQLCENY